MLSKHPSSVVLDLRMPPEQAEKLIRLFRAGALKDLDVVDVEAVMRRPADQEVGAASFNSLHTSDPAGSGDTQEDHLPQQVGRYRLETRLGCGGFGTVWRAHDLDLDRGVALKVPRPGLQHNEEVSMRFLKEAQLTSKLEHPGIPPVHEVGTLPDGRPFFSMKLVKGDTLSELLQQRASAVKDLPRFLDIFKKVCQTLAHVHSRKVIHRDLKPSNIMVGEFGEVQVMDWGLAKVLQADSDSDALRAESMLAAERSGGGESEAGKLIGTPAYMSPEQARGDLALLDERVDVFGLGAILCEILTGKPPYVSTILPEARRQALEGDLTGAYARLDASGVDAELLALARSCLAACPEERPSNAGEVKKRMTAYLVEQRRADAILATGRIWHWCQRNPALAGLTASVAVLLMVITLISFVAALWLGRERNKALSAERARIEQLSESHLNEARALRWSGRDGRRFRSLEALTKATDILRSLNQLDQRVLELRNDAIESMTLADLRIKKEWNGFPLGSKGLAFDARLEHYARGDIDGNIYIHRVADNQETARLKGPGNGAAAWVFRFSPDSKFLIAKYEDGRDSYSIWDLSRGQTVRSGLFDISGAALDCSPDSRFVAVGHHNGVIHLYDLASGQEVKQLRRGSREPSTLAFHPSEQQLAVSVSTAVQVLNVDTDQVLYTLEHPRGVMAVAWHPHGKLLAAACGDFHVYVWDTGTRQLVAKMQGHQAEVVHVSFSQGGDLLASTSWDNTLRLWDPYTGKELVRSSGIAHGSPVFSPNDQLLAAARDGSKIGLWEVATGRECRTFHSYLERDKGPGSMDFGLDGRLLVSLHSDDCVRLWDRLTGHEFFLPLSGTWSAIFSADGRSLFTSGQAGLHRWPIEPDGEGGNASLRIGPPQNLGLGNRLGTISLNRDGRIMAVVRPGTDDTYHAVVFPLDGPTEQVRLEGPCGREKGVMLSPDGKWAAACGGSSPIVKVWDAQSGKLARDWDLSDAGNLAVGFTPDSKWFVIGTGIEYRFWAVGSWQPGLRLPREGTGLAGLMAFSGDGRLMAIARSDKTVQLRDPTTGNELATLPARDPQLLTCLRFSPDGSQLAAACETHVIQVWDLRLIRERLAGMGLDWNLPPYPPAVKSDSPKPLHVKVLPGELAPLVAETRGINHKIRKEYEKAIADFQRALEIDPKRAMSYNQLAWIYVTGPAELRNPDKALAAIQNAIELEPNHPGHRILHGMVYYRLAKPAQAVEILERAVRDFREEAWAMELYFLAMSYHQLGETGKAQDAYKRAVAIQLQRQAELAPFQVDELNGFRAEADALFAKPATP